MNKPISNVSKNKKPKLTEAEKREQIREGLLKKKQFDEKAVSTVEKFLEKNIQENDLIEMLTQMNQGYWCDAVEERALTGLCSYPLCDVDISKNKTKMAAKYHISLKEKKVYELEERRNFCSNLCFKSANHIKDQLTASPLWLRDSDKHSQVQLYKPGHKEKNLTVYRDIEKCYDSDEESEAETLNEDFDEYYADEEMPIKASTNKIDTVVKENNVIPPITRNKPFPNKQNTTVVKLDPVNVVLTALIDWFTVDSYRIVMGVERLKEVLRELKAGPEVWATVVGDRDMSEQFQARYRHLVRRLDMLELLDDDKEEVERMPQTIYNQFKEHSKMENMKMESFLTGKDNYDLTNDLTNKLKIVESDEVDQPRIPLLDHTAQLSLRRRIVLDGLGRNLPDLLDLLGLTYDQIRSDLIKLMSSFSLGADNVVFRPVEWSLLSLCVLKLLSVSNCDLGNKMEDGVKYINMLLFSHNLSATWLDLMVSDLSGDMVKLLSKYNITSLSDN